MTSPLFTTYEIALARLCAAHPDDHGLTVLELRACGAVISHVEHGIELDPEDERLARVLLDHVANEIATTAERAPASR